LGKGVKVEKEKYHRTEKGGEFSAGEKRERPVSTYGGGKGKEKKNDRGPREEGNPEEGIIGW